MAFPEAPVRFGELPPHEASSRLPDRDSLGTFRLDLLLLRALVDSEAGRLETPEERKERAEQTWAAVFGEAGKERKRSLAISSASWCLREWGYGVLGYPPLEKTAEEILPLRTGSAEHRIFLDVLRPFGLAEFPLVLSINEDLVLTGRADFYIYQLRNLEIFLDVKTTSREGLKMVKERGSRPQDELQIELYMKAWERAASTPMVGWLIYKCRDIPPGAKLEEWVRKFAVPFDAVAKYKVEQHLERVVKADEALRRGELPEPSVDPGSAEWACGKSCGFRDRCEPGQKYLADRIRREGKRVPVWVRRKAQAEQALFTQQMAAQMASQPELFDTSDLERRPSSRRPEQSGESKPLTCGDCGSPMISGTVTEKNRPVTKYICPYHGG